MNTSMETLALLDFLIPDYVRTITYVPWVFSLLGSALIGLSGILPLIIIPSTPEGTNKEIKNRKCCFIKFYCQIQIQVSSVIVLIELLGFELL